MVLAAFLLAKVMKLVVEDTEVMEELVEYEMDVRGSSFSL